MGLDMHTLILTRRSEKKLLTSFLLRMWTERTLAANPIAETREREKREREKDGGD